MSKAKILVVEDDPAILLGLEKNLTYEGYEVVKARDGEAGLESAFTERPDLIVLDLMLPGLNGFEICRQVRKHDTTVAILILSAKGFEQDKVLGLDVGADDYMVKPFSVKELLARVRALLRKRKALSGEGELYRFGGTEVDFTARLVRVDGHVIETSKKEFELLRLLIRNRGRVLSRDQILNHVWGYDYDGTPRTIDNFVQKLREKVEKDADNPEFIRTVRGVGYLFEGPAPAAGTGA
ncbi:MAG: response regulator transcription factor [Planctomycetes bacterium]|nr:response regulator transcription factor [Planctomycetota bacterium]